jgi:hypothetical protein
MRSEPHTIRGGRRRALVLGGAAAVFLGLSVAIAVPGGWQGVASTIRDMAYGPGPGQKPVATTTTATFPKTAKTGKVFLVAVKVTGSGAAVKGACNILTVSGTFAQQTGVPVVRGGKCTIKVTIDRPGKSRLRVKFVAGNAPGSKIFLRDSQSKVATVTVTGAPNLGKISLNGFALTRSGGDPAPVTPSGGTIADCSATRGFGGTLVAVYTYTGKGTGVAVDATWQTPAGAPSPITNSPGPGSNSAEVTTPDASPNGSYVVTLALRATGNDGRPTGPAVSTAQGQVTVSCPAPAPTE